MALLTVQNLSVGYEGKPVASGISFSVSSGDYLTIVGENGSGKTTLMKTVLGLLPPVSGKVELGDGLRKNRIGYVPQQTAGQKGFPASVLEVVLSGCLGKSGLFYSKKEKDLATKQMRRMEILPLQNRAYRELSGGQQKRALLARALCAADSMLLLDEPAAGLDPVVTQEMYEVIQSLNREGVAIVMISHDIQAALIYSKTILHLAEKPLYYGDVFGYKREYFLEGEQHA
ncbi:MAG: metal ABC transporter ATP-binding protein [Christensenellales bacterium]|jgi:zinc transport system ATP-binding protein